MRGCCLGEGVSVSLMEKGGLYTFIVFGGWLVDNGTVF